VLGTERPAHCLLPVRLETLDRDIFDIHLAALFAPSASTRWSAIRVKLINQCLSHASGRDTTRVLVGGAASLLAHPPCHGQQYKTHCPLCMALIEMLRRETMVRELRGDANLQFSSDQFSFIFKSDWGPDPLRCPSLTRLLNLFFLI